MDAALFFSCSFVFLFFFLSLSIYPTTQFLKNLPSFFSLHVSLLIFSHRNPFLSTIYSFHGRRRCRRPWLWRWPLTISFSFPFSYLPSSFRRQFPFCLIPPVNPSSSSSFRFKSFHRLLPPKSQIYRCYDKKFHIWSVGCDFFFKEISGNFMKKFRSPVAWRFSFSFLFFIKICVFLKSMNALKYF